MSDIDFGRTTRDYHQHRPGFPDSLFERLSERWPILEQQTVLDLATGTGSLGRGFARLGASVIGVDRSESMIETARVIDVELETTSTRYLVASAESTGLESDAFDWVTAGQAWHWFDRPRAAAEAARLLRSDGHLLIAHFDWLPLPGNVVEATESLIRRFNPSWSMHGGTGFYPAWTVDVRTAGFQGVQTFSYDVDVAFRPAAWRGRIRASAGVGASLPEADVVRFDGALADLLSREHPQDPLLIPHRVFALVARAPAHEEGRSRAGEA